MLSSLRAVTNIHVAGQAAYVDESFQEHPERGFYILAAAIFDDCHSARELLTAQRRELGPPGAPSKLHWTDMDRRRREHIAKQVGTLDARHVAVIGSPVPTRRQERARAVCLKRLVLELHTLGVAELWIEARERELNRRDIRTVAGARYQLPKDARFRVDHLHGMGDPLFWAADVIAGAIRAQRLGNPSHRDQLGDRVREVAVSTEC